MGDRRQESDEDLFENFRYNETTITVNEAPNERLLRTLKVVLLISLLINVIVYVDEILHSFYDLKFNIKGNYELDEIIAILITIAIFAVEIYGVYAENFYIVVIMTAMDLLLFVLIVLFVLIRGDKIVNFEASAFFLDVVDVFVVTLGVFYAVLLHRKRAYFRRQDVNTFHFQRLI